MKKILAILLIFGALGVAGYYLYSRTSDMSNKDQNMTDSVGDESVLAEELTRVVIQLSEFGGNDVVLVNGEASFPIDTGGEYDAQGFVRYNETYDAIWKGEGQADVYAVYYIDGGGTGFFPYLIHFDYVDGTLTESQRLLLGDRIPVHEVHIEQTEPNNYQVWIAVDERLPFEGMAAEPTQPQVYHFFRGPAGLMIGDVAYGTLEKHDVAIYEPLPQDTVTTGELKLRGEARGPWYFEASFPVELINYDGEVVAQSFVTAQSEWMTEELVVFEGVINIPTGTEGLHSLRLKRDNPSGLPEHDDSFEIPLLIN